MLVLREVERRLGLADRLAACLKDPRAPEKVVHRLAQIIRFHMLMIAAGYEDGNDAATLRRDPMFKPIEDFQPWRVSPPAIGRFSFSNRILRLINGLCYTRQPSCINAA